MAFRNTAAELTRQYNQNRNDIEEIYEKIEETNAKVDTLTVRVDGLSTRVDGLSTQFDGLSTRVDGLSTRVDERFAQVDERFDRITEHFDARFDRFDAHFDRLERHLAPSAHELDATSPLDFRPTETEQSIRLLETKMNLYSNFTRSNTEDIERHNQLIAAHDVRFDSLDSQMAEVLDILRGKSA